MGDGKTIIFTPIVTPQGELANKVGDLLSGQVPWLEFSSLSLQFPAVFDGVPAAKSYFAEHSASGDLIATQNTVVSSRWLSNAGSSPRKSFEELGYADLSDLFKDMPKKVRGEITNQALESISGGSGSKLYENFLVRDELLDDMVEAAKTAAAAQAATQWEHSSRSALTLNSTSLIESLSSKHDVPIEMVNSVYKPCLATGARGSFSTQLSSLESSLMIELAKTWEEVVLEWELRSSSLRSSHLQEPSNESLREQLTEILTSYMLADVIRPKIKTAGPSSLQRSPKAAKAIKDFNLNLPADGEDSAQSMRKLQSATDKLRGQLRISVPTTDELSEARETMLMQMRAQLRDMNTDGPRYLLLTLLLLHAQMEGSMGVLYSTGRCVPRLIRSLRGRVDTEALSLLNACKDQVKAGNDLAMDKKKELGALVDPRFGDSG
ncbi:hypothetical protein P152DRAFT_273140 [Eremomyces bilateralis CBS 781.70]|uniref:E3 UFM1-protein ligase-like C-terminal domain-containing protein n=1 Tax=Eremomyces bilateralis CBS 781.70 TaxID=1392243 RepID=A0A6G1G8Y0_9PEZI|nr:uncharacterized protein P152DRAFT_273140 [Eremomyces bilateralis CBS 781.70]KAF1814473.1 hypothetical protein P152DRAFT_273140 [Eremomyces bilateralis CBS 781.70]